MHNLCWCHNKGGSNYMNNHPVHSTIFLQSLGRGHLVPVFRQVKQDIERPVQGNFIRNCFTQESNSTFIVRSLPLYNKNLYARLRLYFNDTLIKKGQKGTWGWTPLSPSNPCLSPPPTPHFPPNTTWNAVFFYYYLLYSFFLLWNTIYANKYCCCCWMGLWQGVQSGPSLRFQVSRNNSSSKWEFEQLGSSLCSIFICIL